MKSLEQIIRANHESKAQYESSHQKHLITGETMMLAELLSISLAQTAELFDQPVITECAGNGGCWKPAAVPADPSISF